MKAGALGSSVKVVVNGVLGGADCELESTTDTLSC